MEFEFLLEHPSVVHVGSFIGLFFSSLWRARSMISHVRFDSPDDKATTANPCPGIGTGKATTLSSALSIMTVSFALLNAGVGITTLWLPVERMWRAASGRNR